MRILGGGLKWFGWVGVGLGCFESIKLILDAFCGDRKVLKLVLKWIGI